LTLTAHSPRIKDLMKSEGDEFTVAEVRMITRMFNKLK
jgi:hypothetical protein